jgi:hypothetical protein
MNRSNGGVDYILLPGLIDRVARIFIPDDLIAGGSAP